LKVTVLSGKHIRLEPVDLSHLDGLVAASAADPSFYQWSPVPQGHAAIKSYIETALAIATRLLTGFYPIALFLNCI
jgi:hypothetical protein